MAVHYDVYLFIFVVLASWLGAFLGTWFSGLIGSLHTQAGAGFKAAIG